MISLTSSCSGTTESGPPTTNKIRSSLGVIPKTGSESRPRPSRGPCIQIPAGIDSTMFPDGSVIVPAGRSCSHGGAGWRSATSGAVDPSGWKRRQPPRPR